MPRSGSLASEPKRKLPKEIEQTIELLELEIDRLRNSVPQD
jgi:hypothetical protein